MKTAILTLAAFAAMTSMHSKASELPLETFTNLEYCQIANAMGPTRTHTLRAYTNRLGYQPSRQECSSLLRNTKQAQVFALESEVRDLRRTSSIRIPSQTLEAMKNLPESEQQVAFERVISRSAPF